VISNAMSVRKDLAGASVSCLVNYKHDPYPVCQRTVTKVAELKRPLLR